MAKYLFRANYTASGAATISTAPLFSAAEVDDLVKRRVDYRPPGS